MHLHLIANAHLDPVWLWDWREGLSEGLITVRTILDLMDEDQELTFIRGEAAIYEHIEKNDPAIFARIAAHVESGRWDIVGGTYVQPDTNLPAVETLARHFTCGLNYFRSRFGRRVTAAWQADSFGHTAGFPEVLAAAGIDSFAFTRPDHNLLPLPEPAFWWEGPGGSRVLAYRPLAGWYGSDRDEMPRRLDALLAAARKSNLANFACFYGLGNHGGGPSRRHLADIRAWAANHPEVKVEHSGLHRFFADLRTELEGRSADVVPVHRGELNFCLRGCYSSVAKFKYLYRRSESLLCRAEKTDALVAGLTGEPAADLDEAWRGLLFNSFHDILPGSGIERAMDDQIHWLGAVVHASQRIEFSALEKLAARVDTRVERPLGDYPSGVALMVWNPHHYPYVGHVELEACLDYRPIMEYLHRPAEIPIRLLGEDRQPLPFQTIATENFSMIDRPWRRRVLTRLSLPAFGWNILELGWVENAGPPPAVASLVRSGDVWIDNGIFRVEAAVGNQGVRISREGRPLLGEEGMTAKVFEDPWGSWGGMLEERGSIYLSEVRETWTVTAVQRLESGPERATLWVRLAGKNSRLDLSFSVCRERDVVDVAARVFWDERSARLKLHFAVGEQAEFEVPGATVERGPSGEVPGGRWLRVRSEAGGFGFASNALYNFDCADGGVSATVVRASRYADDVETPPAGDLWRPAVDAGELCFKFLVTTAGADLPRLARELEQPPVSLVVPATDGPLARKGALASLQPEFLHLLALKAAEDGDGFILRVQAPAGRASNAVFAWLGETIPLGEVVGGRIATWRLTGGESGWKAVRTDLAETVGPNVVESGRHDMTQPFLNGSRMLPADAV